MSSNENESFDSSEKPSTTAQAIAQILRQDYESTGSAIKWIARKTNISDHAVRNWYDAVRAPSLHSFIKLTKASPCLINWFLIQVDRGDLADIINAQNASKNQALADDFDLCRLIFETEKSNAVLKKIQKLTLRQLWFYSKIKAGHKLKPHDLIENFDIARATAYRDVSELCKLGLIHKVGAGKREYYVVV